MSGAEFILVAGLISSLITIGHEIAGVVQAASRESKLPKVFRDAQPKLQLIRGILDATASALPQNEGSKVEAPAAAIVRDCEKIWGKLKELFDKVTPEEGSGASRIDRYRSAARSLGKGSKVEKLLEALMENVKLLATLKIMTEGKQDVIQANPNIEELEEEIEEVKDWKPSLGDDVFHGLPDTDHNTTHISGSNNTVVQASGTNSRSNHISGTHARYFESVTTYNENVAYNHAAPGEITIEATTQACLRFLQCPDTLAIKNSLLIAKDGLIPQAIRWLFENQKYTNWKDNDETPLLWIRGGAGKGKTMLAIGIIENVSSDADTITTYFFCQNGNPELNTIQGIIKGLIFRLVKQHPGAAEILRSNWDPKTERFVKGPPTWQMLWDIFLEMLFQCKCSRVYVAVDALDECQSEVDSFIQHLAQTGLHQPSKIKWLLTSRPLDAARQELPVGSDLVLEDNSDAVAGGVAVYVNEKVNKLKKKKLYNRDLCQEIEEQLVQKAEGTYMWVSLVYDMLKKVDRENALATIRGLPSGLSPLYSRALNELNSGDSVLAEGCIRLLKVIMLAYRPLKMTELKIVSKLFDEPEITSILIDRCSSFIQKQEGVGVIEFVHQSARDYLAEGHGQLTLSIDPYGHGDIMLNCLSYLSPRLTVNMANLPRPDSAYILRETSTVVHMGYAAIFWAQHLGDAEVTNLIQNALKEQGAVGIFIRSKLLEWLECLSLLGKLTYAVEALRTLKGAMAGNIILSNFVQDAIYLLQQHYLTITTWPLQIYSSMIIFSPQTSMVRSSSLNKLPKWLKKIPQIKGAEVCPVMTLHRSPWYTWANSIALSPDGKKFAAMYVNTITIWDDIAGDINQKIIKLTEKYDSYAAGMTFSPDSKRIISGTPSDDGSIKIWDVATGHVQELFYSENLRGRITAVAFSPDGERIAFGSSDHSVKVCDAITGDLLTTFSGHCQGAGVVVFSPDSKQVLSAAGMDVQLWDVETGTSNFRLRAPWGCEAMAFVSNGKKIAIASTFGGIMLCDSKTGNFQGCIDVPPTKTLHVIRAFSADGKQVATETSGTIKSWDITNIMGKIDSSGKIPYLLARDLTFSPDGKKIASSGYCELKLWDAKTGNFHYTLINETQHYMNRYTFSSNSEQIASVHTEKIVIWDVITGGRQKEFRIGIEGIPRVIEFSPDGKQIALGYCNGNITLQSTKTGKVKRELRGNFKYAISSISFSPDGKWIASNSEDSIVRLWDTGTGSLKRTFGSRVNYQLGCEVSFSPDTKWIASTKHSEDTIELWGTTNKPQSILEWIGITSPTPIGRFILVSERLSFGSSKRSGFRKRTKFSEDGQNLLTRCGQVSIEQMLGDQPKSQLEDLGLRGDWICYGKMGVLNLSLFQAEVWAIRDDIMVVGLDNGRLLFLEFDRELLRSMLEKQSGNGYLTRQRPDYILKI
ncbi:hypothetical protein TWF718_002974 [Orbilia javanica]|uniref:Uncharacterized protein n=1 Tax=Orbilia javanica TaxID=47235 RepID=A0AAN8MMF2_9PEZI